jgi:hypothetical protein
MWVENTELLCKPWHGWQDMFAIWNKKEQEYAHMRGRVICFDVLGQAAAFLFQYGLVCEDGWVVVDVHVPRRVLWHATREEDHKYWLYEDDEFIDMTAYAWLDGDDDCAGNQEYGEKEGGEENSS